MSEMAAFLLHDDGDAELGAIKWDELFARGFDFGNQFLQSWEKRGAARAGINPYYAPGMYSSQVVPAGGAPVATTPAAGADDDDSPGFKFTDDGLKIGKTTITYPVMGLGALAFVLIQSRPFGRK